MATITSNEHEQINIKNNQNTIPAAGNYLPYDNYTIMENLIGLGAHFGHPRLDPQAKKNNFILKKINGCNIINLDVTLEKLNKALGVIYNVIAEGKKIFFVTTDETLKVLFKKTAEECGQNYIIKRYQPGTLTNYEHFVEKQNRLHQIKKENMVWTKKEKQVFEKKEKVTKEYFEGLQSYNSKPHIIITIGGTQEHDIIMKEADSKIHVISISDVNIPPINNYNFITIPCNTKSGNTIDYILSLIKLQILSGYEAYMTHHKQYTRENKITESIVS
jgi:small subunit ribosomal protein S2